jgi:hypothetical protein
VPGQKLILRSALVILSMLLATSFAASQNEKNPTVKRFKRVQAKQSNPAPYDQPRKVKAEPTNAYTRWVT